MKEVLTKLIFRVIKSLKKANRIQILFSICLFILGIVVMHFSFIRPEGIWDEVPKSILALGCSFVASILAFPVSQIISRKTKIEVIEGIKQDIEESKINPKELSQIEGLFWDILKEIAKK